MNNGLEFIGLAAICVWAVSLLSGLRVSLASGNPRPFLAMCVLPFIIPFVAFDAESLAETWNNRQDKKIL